MIPVGNDGRVEVPALACPACGATLTVPQRVALAEMATAATRLVDVLTDHYAETHRDRDMAADLAAAVQS
ncbi:MAG TPA: hypothetical protein VFC99_05800 [Acidimicrobiia bacterium]|nr:hypothetical protein [Acidimicrobiia bacterium]